MKLNESRINAQTIKTDIPYGEKTVVSSFTTYLDTSGRTHVDISDGYPANAIPKIWSRDPQTAPTGIASYIKDDAGHVVGLIMETNDQEAVENVINRCNDFQTVMNAIKADYEQETGVSLNAMDVPKFMMGDVELPKEIIEKNNPEIGHMVDVLTEQREIIQDMAMDRE